MITIKPLKNRLVDYGSGVCVSQPPSQGAIIEKINEIIAAINKLTKGE